MKEKHIGRRSLADRGKDNQNAIDDPDNPPWTEEEFKAARLVRPSGGKRALSIRLDSEVLDYFKSEGPGYQSRINAVLLGYVRSQGRVMKRAATERNDEH
jgi:uncharacterized protein (DUF4415 family)